MRKYEKISDAEIELFYSGLKGLVEYGSEENFTNSNVNRSFSASLTSSRLNSTIRAVTARLPGRISLLTSERKIFFSLV